MMTQKFLLVTCCIAAVAAALAPAEASVGLRFDDRVRAQEAIERVYHAHRIGATKTFEETYPRALLEGRVWSYLEQSIALESLWNTTITQEMLDRELARMARGTQMPARLSELYEALGHDAVLIRECLARPILVGRLTRNFFWFDRRFHQEALAEANRLRADLLRYGIEAFDQDSRRSEISVAALADDAVQRVDALHSGVKLPQHDYARPRAVAPLKLGDIGPVQETRVTFVIHAVLEETESSVKLASFAVPKRSWDDWWAETRKDFDEDSLKLAVSAEPFPVSALSLSSSAAPPCGPDDIWDNASLDDFLDPRQGHTALWTGNVMLVFGGRLATGVEVGNGARYDPATDTWTPLSMVDAPAPRAEHGAVWTGTEMIVWGGGGNLDSGGRYNPLTDSWAPTSLAGAPSGRRFHTAVWTGTEMIVWGGFNTTRLDTGGRYDPVADTWAPMSMTDAPAGRSSATAVWTGAEMVVWGGSIVPPGFTNTGGRYDPVADTWTPTSTTGAPGGRLGHAVVWTGDRMIVWGGAAGSNRTDTGGQYDPAMDTWTTTSTVMAPSARSGHSAVWTGTRMLIWGGAGSNVGFDTGGHYDPQNDTWIPLSTLNAPQARWNHAAVWTGDTMIVWGGSGGAPFQFTLNTGGRYNALADSWTPTSAGTGPSARWRHSAVWTGSRMIVWGGGDDSTGGLYDPATDSWTATPTSGAPVDRGRHTAVWTGNEMIVWGGDNGSLSNTGGRFDLATNIWTQTSTTGTPTARRDHTAVWTGNEMIVWGGTAAGTFFSNTGGRYDPSTDTWIATTTSGAPTPRFYHTAVWTGSRMIVWGGYDGDSLKTGGRYDPATDSWSATSLEGSSVSSFDHTAVWTGDRMIVWGGTFEFNGNIVDLTTGGRYDPETDTWAYTTTSAAPAARANHTAVWTGEEMLIWGGNAPTNTGGRYNPVQNAWLPISTLDAPAARAHHTAVWSGSAMLVLGGFHFSSGGRYVLGSSADADGDGHLCGADCDDSDGGVFAAPTEVTGLQFSADKITLAWTSAAASAGPGTLHEVLRGTVVEMPVGSGPAEACLDPIGSLASIVDDEVPTEGMILWYLVRGRNGCGTGTYGFDGSGAERFSMACP